MAAKDNEKVFKKLFEEVLGRDILLPGKEYKDPATDVSISVDNIKEMSNMEILNTIDNTKEIYWVCFCVIIILAVFFTTVIASIKIKDKSLLFINLASIILIIISVDAYENYRKKEYEVIVKDIKQFDFDKYKIIEQRGKIIRIEEIK